MTQHNAFEHICAFVGASYAGFCVATAEALPLIVQLASLLVLAITFVFYVYKIKEIRKGRKKE